MNSHKFFTLCLLMLTTVLAASCDGDFYLSEKEFYALNAQIVTQDVANQVFSNLQHQQLRITFDNSVSPPRIQNTNLQDVMRNGLPTLGIIEGYPSYALRIDRVSGEIERQFDNFLTRELRLYTGTNNAKARLERVEELRIRFTNNPTFAYSPNKITYYATVQASVDCRVRIDALDPITNFFAGGVNGTYDVSIDLNNMQLIGEIAFGSNGETMSNSISNVSFKMTPTLGSVGVRDRGTTSSNTVKNGIATFVRQMFKSPINETFKQEYNNFSLTNCQVSGEFNCKYNALPASQTPELHTVARGTDNKLYAAVRRDGVWSQYTQICCLGGQIPINFNSDPTLAVSSAGTIELAATTSTGEIVTAQYQNGWKNFRFVLPLQGQSYRGKPAVVASAPGQLEIFVARSNGTIAHLRRINGTWTQPANVNLPLSTGIIPNVTFLTYRDPQAVQSGNKIFLAAVSSTSRIYAQVFDLETGFWAQSSQVTTAETVSFTPSFASSGDGRVDLAYVGQSGNVFHRPLQINAVNIPSGAAFTGFVLSPETTISASVNAAPVLQASGYRQLMLVARGTDNVLYYNHFAGTNSPTGMIDGRNIAQGWNGWDRLNGNFIGTQLLANEYTEEFGLSATRTGKIDIVARLRANTFQTAYTLHHNSFDAADYGRKPWKAVHWRGYQKIGNLHFSGRPAAAALDGNLELGFAGQNSQLFKARQGTNFGALVGYQISGNPAVDPVAVSSGKGLTDFLTVGTDRKISQQRYFNNFGYRGALLPGQTNVHFQLRPAVVGYGDGQLDVIGVSTSGTIHHWRYVNGAWQNPRQISGTVSSAPVLVNTGSGQLEFFAVGGDGKLYRWRFTGGAWGNWQQLPSSFTINASKFGQGSAASWGDGTVDLAVNANPANGIGSVGSVRQRHVEPRDDTVAQGNLPAQTFQLLGTFADDQPFIAALSQREKIVVVKSAFNPRFDFYWLDSSGAWQFGCIQENAAGLRIGGLVAHQSGAAAAATDANGKLYFHNRLNAAAPRFDFAPVIEQTAQSQLQTPFFRPAIASHGGQ